MIIKTKNKNKEQIVENFNEMFKTNFSTKQNWVYDVYGSAKPNHYSILNRRLNGDTSMIVESTMSMILEAEMDKATVVLAAKNTLDKIQKNIEDITKIQMESVLELNDSIKLNFGSEKAAKFIEENKEKLEIAINALIEAKETFCNHVAAMQAEVNGEEAPQEQNQLEEPPSDPQTNTEMDKGLDDDIFGNQSEEDLQREEVTESQIYQDPTNSKNSYKVRKVGNDLKIEFGKGFDGNHGIDFTIFIDGRAVNHIKDLMKDSSKKETYFKDQDQGGVWKVVRTTKYQDLIFKSIIGSFRMNKDDAEQIFNVEKKINKNIVIRAFNKEKVMAAKPTLIGTVEGISFYEHPTKGDESPLIADTGEEFGLTDYWELPEAEDLNEGILDKLRVKKPTDVVPKERLAFATDNKQTRQTAKEWGGKHHYSPTKPLKENEEKIKKITDRISQIEVKLPKVSGLNRAKLHTEKNNLEIDLDSLKRNKKK